MNASFKTTSDLNQRKTASTNGTLIQTIPKNTSVTWYGYSFVENGKEWKLVEYKNKLGFCVSTYLKR